MSGKIKPKPKQKVHTGIYGLIIVLFAFILYGNSIPNEYNLDDEFVTNGNPQIAKGIKAIPEIFTTLYSQRQNLSYGYRPVVKATYAIEYQFFGWNPHISHFINVFLYGLCCLLLLSVLMRIFKNYNKWFLLIIVLLFAAHPVHTEVVNSLKNRDEILSLLFALCSTLSLLRYLNNKGILALFTGIVCFVLAILSKLNAVTFIAIIPLAVYFMNNKKEPVSDDFKIRIRSKGFYFSKFLEILKNGILIFFVTAHLYLLFIIYGIKFPVFVFHLLFLVAGILNIIENLKGKNKKRQIIIYIISSFIVTIIISAIFVKTPVVSLILCLFALTVLYLKLQGKQKYNDLIQKAFVFIKKNIVFIAIAGILLLVFLATYYLPKAYLPETIAKVDYWQNPQYFADPSSYITNGFYTLLFYGKLLIFPYELSFYYGFNMFPSVGFFNYRIILSILITIALLLYAFATVKKKNIISFGILFYFISISVFSNFYVPVAGIVGERLVFIASVGFSIVLVAVIYIITKTPFNRGKLKSSSMIILAMVLLIFSARTISRNPDWKDRHSLFSADIGHLQNSLKANDLMAALLFGEVKKDIDKNGNSDQNRNKLSQVIGYYSQSLKVYPQHFNAYYNIGLVYLIYFRDYNNAISNFENCLRINPEFTEAYPDLAYSYSMTGNMKKAIEKGELLLSKDSNNITNIAFLSDLRLKNKDFDICNKLNKRIISLSPNSEVGYISQGNLFIAKGDTLKALESMEKAFEKNRSNRNTAIALFNFYNKTGNKEKAGYYKNLLNSKGN